MWQIRSWSSNDENANKTDAIENGIVKHVLVVDSLNAKLYSSNALLRWFSLSLCSSVQTRAWTIIWMCWTSYQHLGLIDDFVIFRANCGVRNSARLQLNTYHSKDDRISILSSISEPMKMRETQLAQTERYRITNNNGKQREKLLGYYLNFWSKA